MTNDVPLAATGFPNAMLNVELSPDEKQRNSTVETVSFENRYRKEDVRKLKRKIDLYLLPLMWLCYGIQQADKTAISTQAVFGLRTDTKLVGQQYSWLTTIFYIAYLTFEFPSTLLLQRYNTGMCLSIYMICWGIVVICIGFCRNFSQLMALRAMQGLFECSISPGFLFIIGSWYKTREHSSRALIFESAISGVLIFTSLMIYGIGSAAQQHGKADSAWRYISYFLGGLTTIIGALCLFVLGTPSEVRWLTAAEKEMATDRVVVNQIGHDGTGKRWKWQQARECLVDPCFWLAGFNAFLWAVPNGGLTTFGSILYVSFGFTNLQTLLIDIPRATIAIFYIAFIGYINFRWRDLRLYSMMISVFPPIAGFLGMSLLPNDPHHKWTKWGCYVLTTPFCIAIFLAWSLIPSNIAGRTKRVVTSSWVFIGYCVGNICGSQIFKASQAPKYKSGTIGCAICFGIEFLVILTWRIILVRRNKARARSMELDGISKDERMKRGEELGTRDFTDFENPYFVYAT